MASRALAAAARSADDYKRVYGELLRQCRGKVILHWLGEMFDPALAGYWGSKDIETAMQTVLGIIARECAAHRGHQGLAARRQVGSVYAQPPAGGREDVHRR